MPILGLPTRRAQPSHFTGLAPKVTKEQIAASISAEVKRVARPKQLQLSSTSTAAESVSLPFTPPPVTPPSVTPPPQPSTSHDAQLDTGMSENLATSPSSFFNALSPSKKDVPLFTFKQVSMVCERMLKEREEQLCQQYDQVLTSKLAEQYEAFLKFTHNQLHRRYNEGAASCVS